MKLTDFMDAAKVPDVVRSVMLQDKVPMSVMPA